MDDNDEFARKNPRDCANAAGGCARTATIGYETCARCRLRALAARHPEVLGPVDPAALAGLTEKAALSVERPFRAALNARDVARHALALALGAPAVERPEGADVTCTFARPGEALDARA